MGLLGEMGPYVINQKGDGLLINPNSWNKVSNLVFLESPVGVGYSYATDKNLTSNDDSTAIENYNAIVDFLEKFSDFKINELYITGESYAGVYIPMLAGKILDEKNVSNINLKVSTID